jgi:hypothetical protein
MRDMTKRQKQEKMLHFVCGLGFDTLAAMTDAQVDALYRKHLSNM